MYYFIRFDREKFSLQSALFAVATFVSVNELGPNTKKSSSLKKRYLGQTGLLRKSDQNSEHTIRCSFQNYIVWYINKNFKSLAWPRKTFHKTVFQLLLISTFCCFSLYISDFILCFTYQMIQFHELHPAVIFTVFGSHIQILFLGKILKKHVFSQNPPKTSCMTLEKTFRI